MTRIFTAILITLSTISCCSAQTVCEKLIQLKKECYGFKPSDLDEKQKEKKSADLDRFWNFAQSNPDQSVECLKDMVLSEKNDTYFCFDGSSLLLQLDKKERYLDVVVEGLQKSDLTDLQLEPYLRICFWLGSKGKDISKLTEKLISYPNARVYLTIHVITLSAIDASLFLYNVMGTENAERSLINSIKNGNPTAKHNAAVVLNLLSTTKGDSLINGLINNKTLADSTIKFILNDRKQFTTKNPACNPSKSREEVLSRLENLPPSAKNQFAGFAGNNDLICSAENFLTLKDEEAVRSARQKSLPGLSDEALHEYFTLTGILMTIRGVK